MSAEQMGFTSTTAELSQLRAILDQKAAFNASYEGQYLNLLGAIKSFGEEVPNDRTGIGTKRRIACQIDSPDQTKHGFPLLTTRPISFKIAFWETMMFVRGITDTKFLEDKGINIWKGNTTREFLDARGLHYLPEGDMGTGYGHTWRNFGGQPNFATCECHMGDFIDYQPGIDQFAELLNGLARDPFGRRHVVSGWDPSTLRWAALPPCHMIQQYFVRQSNIKGEWYLDNVFYMRSTDVPFGLPYNMASYSLLNALIASYLTNFRGELVTPRRTVYMGGDCHIYRNQFDMVDEQLSRIPTTLPQLYVPSDIRSLDDLISVDYANVHLEGYKPQPKIASTPSMAV